LQLASPSPADFGTELLDPRDYYLLDRRYRKKLVMDIHLLRTSLDFFSESGRHVRSTCINNAMYQRSADTGRRLGFVSTSPILSDSILFYSILSEAQQSCRCHHSYIWQCNERRACITVIWCRRSRPGWQLSSVSVYNPPPRKACFLLPTALQYHNIHHAEISRPVQKKNCEKEPCTVYTYLIYMQMHIWEMQFS